MFLAVVGRLMVILALSFSVNNLLLFYILFELSLVPTFVLIMKWGYQPERVQASLYIIIYTVCASLPLLFCLVFAIRIGYSLSVFFVYEDSSNSNIWIWRIFIIVAFFVKIPLYFTHLWLPKAHVEAPVAGSIILAGVLLKLGSYGLVRVMKVWYDVIFKFSEFFCALDW